MKLKRMIIGILFYIGIFNLSACAVALQETPQEADFSGIQTVCELATLKCYYHNVAKSETEASGIFGFFGVGYKKIWTEYSGVVELGIDVSKVSIENPDAQGVVRVYIPNAEILNIDLDESSMSEPLTDTGFMTTITKEEETQALAVAQDNMKETVREDTALLIQAKERAKNVIEGYIKNVGEQISKEYTVEWIEVE